MKDPIKTLIELAGPTNGKLISDVIKLHIATHVLSNSIWMDLGSGDELMKNAACTLVKEIDTALKNFAETCKHSI